MKFIFNLNFLLFILFITIPANCFEKWQNVGILKADQNTIHPNTITGLRGVNNFTEDRQQDGTSSSATKFVFSQ